MKYSYPEAKFDNIQTGILLLITEHVANQFSFPNLDDPCHDEFKKTLRNTLDRFYRDYHDYILHFEEDLYYLKVKFKIHDQTFGEYKFEYVIKKEYSSEQKQDYVYSYMNRNKNALLH